MSLKEKLLAVAQNTNSNHVPVQVIVSSLFTSFLKFLTGSLHWTCVINHMWWSDFMSFSITLSLPFTDLDNFEKNAWSLSVVISWKAVRAGLHILCEMKISVFCLFYVFKHNLLLECFFLYHTIVSWRVVILYSFCRIFTYLQVYKFL